MTTNAPTNARRLARLVGVPCPDCPSIEKVATALTGRCQVDIEWWAKGKRRDSMHAWLSPPSINGVRLLSWTARRDGQSILIVVALDSGTSGRWEAMIQSGNEGERPLCLSGVGGYPAAQAVIAGVVDVALT